MVLSPIEAGAVEISLGRAHGCARMQDASVRCWGAFAEHGLGEPTTVSQTSGCVPEKQQAWGEVTPASRPADEYADAALAWAQERCRLNKEGRLLEECVRDETMMLNGCLQSLGGSEPTYSTCAGAVLWDAAYCAATSSPDDASTVERCQPDVVAACGYLLSPVLFFCAHQSLDCSVASATYLVPNDLICDDNADCPNAFDEANCTPDADVFTCADRTTVPLEAFARGELACADGSGPD
jgi:hypothetical protein